MRDQLADGESARLLRWYRRDENQLDARGQPMPVYVLQPRENAYRLLAQREQAQQMWDEGQRQAWEKAWDAEQQRWDDEKAILQRMLRPVAQHIPGIDLLDYTASVTRLEIEQGVFPLDGHAPLPLCFFRTIQGAPPEHGGFIEQDPTNRTLLAELKQRLCAHAPDQVHGFTASWGHDGPTDAHRQSFCDLVSEHLHARVDAALAETAPTSSLDASTRTYFDFARTRTDYFTGRDPERRQIAAYLTDAAPRPLLITGPAGSGKSALTAQAAREARDAHPDAVIHELYIGVTPESSTTRSLLEDISRRATRSYGGDESAIPTDEQLLIQTLSQWLALASATQPLLLFIDALDQIRDNGQRGLWIPATLPPHVRLVVTV